MKDFVVGSDRVLAKLDSPNLKGWITVNSIKELVTYAKKPVDRTKYPTPVWKGSKFPAALMKQVLGTIHEFPRMETAYSLYYNIRTKEWAVKCPEQNGGGASVSYEDDGSGMPEGYSIIGSIHTHPEMSAFWSGTDLNDQTKKHGIHFVFGLRGGLVATSLCTVFTPTEQFDQELREVVEDFDWNQVYEPVAEWVETIKKQSYHRTYPATTVYTPKNNYSYPTSYRRPKINPGHYGSEHRVHRDYEDLWEDYYSATSFIDDYSYTPRWYSAAGYNYGTDDRDEQQEKYIKIIDDAITITSKSESFRAALLDPQTRGELENQLDLILVDASDKGEVISGFSELTAVIPQIEKTTNEEEAQVVSNILDAFPNVNLIDQADPGFRNAPMMDHITDLMDGLVNAYCENPNCLDEQDVNTLLYNLKTWYETVLMIGAEQDTKEAAEEPAETTEAEEC